VHLSLLRSNSWKFQPLDVHGTNSFLPEVFLTSESKPAAQYWIFPTALENSIRETFHGTEFRGFSIFQKETFHWEKMKNCLKRGAKLATFG
jgi:hypothetical protein